MSKSKAKTKAAKAPKAKSAKPAKAEKTKTKLQTVIDLLKRPEGATNLACQTKVNKLWRSALSSSSAKFLCDPNCAE